jgi:cytochrome P450
VKSGLTADALRSYVQLIALETEDFVGSYSDLQGPRSAMAELTIYTASRSLQGKEVRAQFDSDIAGLFHDLDMRVHTH